MTPLVVGQAVVTDPGTEGAAGYMLVAASPSLAPADREQLAAVPQVSDFLHVQSEPRGYFSFHRLPSGDWCFAKRFARGWRRGSLRIVVHSLVVSEEVMEALAWDAWLLPACSFRRTGGQAANFQELTDWPDDRTPTLLPDLVIEPPGDPAGQRLAMLERRRGFLLDRCGEEDLRATLAEALAALEAKRGMLLPQSLEHEQLLALAWSALPRTDRPDVPWTTHLAPGTRALFRLANAPRPEEARAAESTALAWSVPGERLPGAGAAALARALVTGAPPWREVATQWYEARGPEGLSLLGDGGQVKRWLLFRERGGPPPDGFPSLAVLADYLDARGLEKVTGPDPWEQPSALLEVCAGTLARLRREQPGVPESSVELRRLLRERDLHFAASTLEGLAHREIDADTLLAAVELSLLEQRPLADTAQVLQIALTTVRARADRALAGALAARIVAPALATQPDLGPLLADQIGFVLGSLRSEPDGFVEALGSWPDALYDRAVTMLQRWADEEPRAAEAVARRLGTTNVKRVVRERQAIRGLAERLAAAGAPPMTWLRLALAEAAVIDGPGDQVGGDLIAAASFAKWLSRWTVPDAVALAAAAELRRRLLDPRWRRGEAHRVLVQKLAAALAAAPAETAAAFTFFAQLSDAELRAWVVPLVAVAAALDERSREHASALCRNWYTLLATRHPWEEPPAAAAALLAALTKSDADEVARIWSPRVVALPSGLVADRLRQLIGADPERRRNLETAALRARIASGEVPLAEGVAGMAELYRGLSDGGERFTRVLEELLPRDLTQRAQRLLALLLAPQLYPSTKRLIERRFFVPALARVGPLFAAGFQQPEAVQALVRRGATLLLVAERLGEMWPEAKYDARDALRQLRVERRGDAVAAFLRGAAIHRRRSFLDWLAREGDLKLAAKLREDLEHPVHRWDLAPYRARLRSLVTNPTTEVEAR